MRLNTAQRLALNLDAHIVIDAGAGTGKTSTIVDRVIEHYLTSILNLKDLYFFLNVNNRTQNFLLNMT